MLQNLKNCEKIVSQKTKYFYVLPIPIYGDQISLHQNTQFTLLQGQGRRRKKGGVTTYVNTMQRGDLLKRFAKETEVGKPSASSLSGENLLCDRMSQLQVQKANNYTKEMAVIKDISPSTTTGMLNVRLLYESTTRAQPSRSRMTVTCKKTWDDTCYRRMNDALLTFALGPDLTTFSEYIYRTLLGNNISRYLPAPSRHNVHVDAPMLPTLNESQLEAVQSALQGCLTLIQGPPGTGKTTTSATIVYQMVKSVRSQILVCSPSNVAVDHIAERISSCGLSVVRLYSYARGN